MVEPDELADTHERDAALTHEPANVAGLDGQERSRLVDVEQVRTRHHRAPLVDRQRATEALDLVSARSVSSWSTQRAAGHGR